MAKKHSHPHRLVYSTASGRACPECGRPIDACQCQKKRKQTTARSDGIVRIRQEKKGRRGKTVTTISGIPLDAELLKQLASQLKRKCGTGGSVKDGVIEIQGDHRAGLKAELEKLGYTVKLAGG